MYLHVGTILYSFLRSHAAIMYMCVCACVCVCVCVCVHATCRGRLSMREQHPKASSSRLVRMKALMALVTFWILRSLLGPTACLAGAQIRGALAFTSSYNHIFASVHHISCHQMAAAVSRVVSSYLFSVPGGGVFSSLHSFIFQSMMYPIRGHVTRHSSCSVPKMEE